MDTLGTKKTPFNGTFDGQNFSIYGLYIDNETNGFYQGLFGCIKGANICNLSIKKSCIKAFNTVGAIVGAATDKSTLFNCHNYATVSGRRNNIGGLIGVSAEDNTYIDCSNYGEISGLHRIGGIIGSSLGKIAIYNCYNNGHVYGTYDDIGGILGYMTIREKWTYTLINCFNNGQIKGRTYVSGIIGGIGGDYILGVIPDPPMPMDFQSIESTDETPVRFSSSSIPVKINTDTSSGGKNSSIEEAKRTPTKIYFSNLYNSGRIESKYVSHTDGLVGRYEMEIIPAGIKKYGGNCFWNIDKCTITDKTEQWQEFVESPDNIASLSDEFMKSIDFVKSLNDWIDKHKSKYKYELKYWTSDTLRINEGYPIFENIKK
ncbi:hypothetical protein IR083_05195 [Dysgonomonas sp. GY75]|uniref:hypothetical protein n=1 Tax=Dysgonomonas sp. GY75 TaxID=2780419 RepID=UPI0018839627|nr:hypothetical protein [Dysgonomonas sp. GY75]MBF0648203.1 hypothetical protein [Dysgonomonas sp. GY75]